MVLKDDSPQSAKKYCIDALEILRGFYLFHQYEITPALLDYDNTPKVDIHFLRDTLLHSGFFTSEEITQINRDWGLVEDNTHQSTSRTKITV